MSIIKQMTAECTELQGKHKHHQEAYASLKQELLDLRASLEGGAAASSGSGSGRTSPPASSVAKGAWGFGGRLCLSGWVVVD